MCMAVAPVHSSYARPFPKLLVRRFLFVVERFKCRKSAEIPLGSTDVPRAYNDYARRRGVCAKT